MERREDVVNDFTPAMMQIFANLCSEKSWMEGHQPIVAHPVKHAPKRSNMKFWHIDKTLAFWRTE